MKVFVLGGSRNIGYFSAQRYLENGATVTFLLRNPSCFDADESIKPYVTSGKARLVHGDAFKEEDIKKAWDVASEGNDGPLDIVLSSLGPTPNFSLKKGLIVNPQQGCTCAMLHLLAAFPRDPASQPKLVFISSNGLGQKSHDALPFILKPMYGYLLDGPDGPHADKLGMERVVAHAAGWEWPATEDQPEKAVLTDGWQERVGPSGWLKHVVVVRPALLTNGECKADAKTKSAKPPYRAEDVDMCGSFTISRKDVAHFIVSEVSANWQKWDGKCVRIAY